MTPRSQAPPTFHASRAYLVRSFDLGEADRRVVFFSEEMGLVPLMAKSALRSRKRFGGLLQRYLLLDVSWHERPNRASVLDSVSLRESHWGIVSSWEKVRSADSLLGVASSLFPQPGGKPRAFRTVLSMMREVDAGTDPDVVFVKGTASLLSIAGWGPNLSGCPGCGTDDGAGFRFIPSEGRVFCRRCRVGGGVPISTGAVKTWRHLQGGDSAGMGRVRVGGGILQELRVVIGAYLEWCMGRSLDGGGS